MPQDTSPVDVGYHNTLPWAKPTLTLKYQALIPYKESKPPLAILSALGQALTGLKHVTRERYTHPYKDASRYLSSRCGISQQHESPSLSQSSFKSKLYEVDLTFFKKIFHLNGNHHSLLVRMGQNALLMAKVQDAILNGFVLVMHPDDRPA
jgi:hypothetical protein